LDDFNSEDAELDVAAAAAAAPTSNSGNGTAICSPQAKLDSLYPVELLQPLAAFFTGMHDSNGCSYPDEAVSDVCSAICVAAACDHPAQLQAWPASHHAWITAMAKVAEKNGGEGGNFLWGEMCCRALFIDWSRLHAPDDIGTLRCLGALADLLRMRQQESEAEQCYEACLEGQKKVLGNNHRLTQHSRFELAKIREKKIKFATEWLDEDSRVCPKLVDYARQCPKGHTLVPFADCGILKDEPQRFVCRVCHEITVHPSASQLYVCSVTGCCGCYAVCSCCVSKLAAASKSVTIKEDFSLCGISVDYLRWLHAEFGPLLGRITTSQFEKMYLRPRSALLCCSVAEELAAHAATAHHVGHATWFISHTWSNAFADTLEAILNFF
jgi:hypothetical protein